MFKTKASVPVTGIILLLLNLYFQIIFISCCLLDLFRKLFHDSRDNFKCVIKIRNLNMNLFTMNNTMTVTQQIGIDIMHLRFIC